MANEPLSIPEKSALLALLMLNKPVSNPEIHDLYGFSIEKDTRGKLVEQGLISAEISKAHRRAYLHELTDKGWQRAREQFAEEAPQGSQRKDRMLYGLAQWVDTVFTRQRITLADVYASDDSLLDALILKTYNKLIDEPGDWVRLATLRTELSDVSHKRFKAALIRLAELPDMRFIPEENQKALTDADHRAALQIGGQDKHLMAIQDS